MSIPTFLQVATQLGILCRFSTVTGRYIGDTAIDFVPVLRRSPGWLYTIRVDLAVHTFSYQSSFTP